MKANTNRVAAEATLARISEQLAGVYPADESGLGDQDSCVDENIQREIRVPVSVLGIGVHHTFVDCVRECIRTHFEPGGGA